MGIHRRFLVLVLWFAFPGVIWAHENWLRKLPLHFEPTGRENQFRTNGPKHSILVEAAGLRVTGKGHPNLRIRLEGARENAAGTGFGPLPGRSHYFFGRDRRRWRANVPHYERVRFAGVYPNIDVEYYGRQGTLEYDFLLAPGADPRAIRMSLLDGGQPRISSEGDILFGGMRLRKPVAYQQIGGERREVAAAYVRRGRALGIRMGRYDRSRPLVIDPQFVYSTYLGGSGVDIAQAVAVDASGAAYVAGITRSPDFPTADPLGPGVPGFGAFYVAKLNPSGTALLFTTFIGGGFADPPLTQDIGPLVSLALDPTGNVYLGGPGAFRAEFPFTSEIGADQRAGAGGAFALKLSPDGSRLVYAVLLKIASFGGIAVDASGSAVISGSTFSPDFPGLVAPASGTSAGAVLVASFNAEGAPVFSRVFGGTGLEEGSGVALDRAGNIYVTGRTRSSDFPVTRGALQVAPRGFDDAFVVRLSRGGEILYATFLGGAQNDAGKAITVDAGGNIYLAGVTQSQDFPILNPIFPELHPGRPFLAKIDAPGANLAFSTLLPSQYAPAVAVHSSGDVFIAGNGLLAPRFPGTLATGGAAFVARVDPQSARAVYGTFVNFGFVASVAVDEAGNAYVAGLTQSVSPLPAPGLQGRSSGTWEAILFKLGPGNPVPVATRLPTNRAPAGTASFALTVQGRGFNGFSVVRWNGQDRPTTFLEPSSDGAQNLSAILTADDLAREGTAEVTVHNPAPDGGTSAPLIFTIAPRSEGAPVILSMTPTGALAGTQSLTLSVDASNVVAQSFGPRATIHWNGSERLTTIQSNRRTLRTTLTAADLAEASVAQVTVVNPGGFASEPAPFPIATSPFPRPQITQLTPASGRVGDADFVLTVAGSGFVPLSRVQFAGTFVPTTLVQESELRAMIPGSSLSLGGSKSVRVLNPAPGGGFSAAIEFPVEGNPIPEVTSIRIDASPDNSPLLTVFGRGFLPSSVIRWNGGDRPTTQTGSITLQTPLTATDLLGVRSAEITVFNPPPAGGVSAPYIYTVFSPFAPAFFFVNPAMLTAGSTSATLTTEVDALMPGAFARWNARNRPTQASFTGTRFTTIRATLTPEDVAQPGIGEFSVVNPDGRTSEPRNVFVALPLPSNDFILDRSRNRLWVSVPGSAPERGNSVVPLSLDTGTIGAPIPVGEDPRRLAISSDGRCMRWSSPNRLPRCTVLATVISLFPALISCGWR